MRGEREQGHVSRRGLLAAMGTAGIAGLGVGGLTGHLSGTVADTADALGVSPGAVRNRTIRALDRLRAVLGPSLRDLLET